MDANKGLEEIVIGLVEEYAKIKKLYDSAGLDVKIKESALQGMVNTIQLQQVAIQNYANWRHVTREDRMHQAGAKKAQLK
jgi:hypothetical protein